jgi:hypothetical protein
VIEDLSGAPVIAIVKDLTSPQPTCSTETNSVSAVAAASPSTNATAAAETPEPRIVADAKTLLGNCVIA